MEIRAIRAGVAACLDGRARGLVTGPIHKGRLAARGFPYRGHTGFLGALCGVEAPVMAFLGERIRVALVTVHIPLSRVPAAIDTERIVYTGRLAATALECELGIPRPRMLVCGLNPHAGDQGAIGVEDVDVVAPAVEALRAAGIDASGPFAAERAFRSALAGQGDLVLAMYHDQGLLPLKVLGGLDGGTPAVNWTLGLPIVRTSVDHGTADDIAGRDVADPSSMEAAIVWALRLTAQRNASSRVSSHVL